MRRALVRVFAACVVLAVGLGAVGGTTYWLTARRFVAEDAHALDGIVRVPVDEPVVFRNVTLWDGRGDPVRHGRSVVVRHGHIVQIVDAAVPLPPDARPIDASGKTLIPGLIDAHVHLMYDSGPDLLTRAPQLLDEWLETTRGYPAGRAPIVRRGQLKLKAGVTTMRILGDGYYSLAYRDDVARWEIVGPRVLTAGLHVNGPNGYVSGG
jgi:imidazolonepropionase-like amidohydrolase